ncbi:UDP-3-O-(3-hydroxymyristoyl)glucosamine N-acyltransferase [Aquicoccus porphyridii]|uniref:UDP-3-O-acylglucosamine N-acyltransferase n=1 Tax=Aquicoccus porphyridii TaxID=1852029 RepID=A0A5A9ZU55_9RHOB|nr:UDP-3-O-(3-hydroxymyristoyl)glucosamine N-acyltransferase [Aquicoccus porphyridii]KAA0920893.1 UDP-3-O-(3-hydroxymyristoyl)glucosamine N-acyltransferase [Aquicoccus porphyridii]RAI56567.1 UDP-3-O-(3-hydroxymyristoyl)glucosamine N-acyltransferase [Rhodobacteraceae bacterium AsT-22]
MGQTISEIAEALGAKAFGDVSIEITGVAEPADAGPADLALATRRKYAESLSAGRARAAMLWEGADWQALGLEAAIIPARPRFAMAGLTAALDKGPGYTPGIHPSAIIGDGADIGADVAIGPFSVIGAGARIGAGSTLGPQVYVGPESEIGENALLHVGVKIGPRVRIGARLIAHPGATIGMDGFSFVTPEVNSVEQARESLGSKVEDEGQSWARIHSLGAVEIGDDVELGCNTCIDAGTIRATRIGNGTKIDNLGHIGHNVVIGHDCLFAGMVGVAGSSVIGNNVVLGGQVGVTDNTIVGDRVVAGGASVILSKVPAGRVVLGYPAVRMDQHVDIYKALRRLPRMMDEFAAMKARLAELDPGE